MSVMTSKRRAYSTAGSFATACLTGVLISSLTVWGCRKREGADADEGDAPPAVATVDHLPLPAAPAQGYVGSQACAACHQKEVDEYHGHPMASSLASTLGAEPVESYEQTEFSPLPGFEYYVERNEDAVIHHERRRDADGEVIYDQGIPVHFAVGSGTRGRTYLINDEGRLYASMVTWYTESGQWGLSPGYQPGLNLRFERRVSEGCIACHSGRVEKHPAEQDRFASQPFLEESIGCERCHGPGESHIAFRSGTPEANSSDPIFNPANVSDARRDAVCNQCHLQGRRRVVRYGKSEFDFRPGQFLSDNWITFLKTEGVAEGDAAAVSQVEQMYASRCYTATQGALSCITCHDSHDVPQGEARHAAHRQKCLSCHSPGQTECSESLETRHAATEVDSCMVCHMPKFPAVDVHAAQTDHRILKRPAPNRAEPRPVGQRPMQQEAVIFEEPGAVVPDWELNRARGITLAERVQLNDERTAVPAINLLLSVIPRAPQDLESRYAAGIAFHAIQQPSLAVQAWEQALEIQSEHEDTLHALASLYHELKELPAAREYYERLLKVNPGRSQSWGRLAHVLGQLGELEAGIEAANRALEINPSLMQTHQWLAEVYHRVGKHQQAAVHEDIYERLQQAPGSTGGPPPSRPPTP
ncbi:MAG: hypothetical protein KF774_16645 [Planctomyces sp.]|nr:hypothetical protein [Planctomyces sp.]